MNETSHRKFKNFTDIHERILRDVPDVRTRWQATDAKREIALMLSGVRKQAGLSQKQVAERTGWDKSFVSRLEGASGGVPDTETIARYATACGATVGMIIGRQTDDHLHVIHAVTLHDTQGDPISEPFERLRDQDLPLSVAEEPMTFER